MPGRLDGRRLSQMLRLITVCMLLVPSCHCHPVYSIQCPSLFARLALSLHGDTIPSANHNGEVDVSRVGAGWEQQLLSVLRYYSQYYSSSQRRGAEADTRYVPPPRSQGTRLIHVYMYICIHMHIHTVGRRENTRRSLEEESIAGCEDPKYVQYVQYVQYTVCTVTVPSWSVEQRCFLIAIRSEARLNRGSTRLREDVFIVLYGTYLAMSFSYIYVL